MNLTWIVLAVETTRVDPNTFDAWINRVYELALLIGVLYAFYRWLIHGLERRLDDKIDPLKDDIKRVRKSNRALWREVSKPGSVLPPDLDDD